MFTPNGFDEDGYFDNDGSGSGESVIVSGWPEDEIEARAEKVYAAAVGVAAAELGGMPAEIITWKRNVFEGAVEHAAQTW